MSYDMVQEDVPPLRTRVGDQAIHGSNNSVLILGRDRAAAGPATVDDGLGDQDRAGAAHLIVGRSDKMGDPDFKKDSGFLYMSMRTRLDENLDSKPKGVPVENDVSGAVLKSDCVRVMGRKSVRILMEDSKNFVHVDGDHALVSIGDGSTKIDVTNDSVNISIAGGSTVIVEKSKITVDGDQILLGKNAVERIIKGDSFKTYFLNHKHPTGVGPSGPPIDPWIDQQLLSSRKAMVE